VVNDREAVAGAVFAGRLPVYAGGVSGRRQGVLDEAELAGRLLLRALRGLGEELSCTACCGRAVNVIVRLAKAACKTLPIAVARLYIV